MNGSRAEPATLLMPIAQAALPAGKVSVRIAPESAMSIAPPTPCRNASRSAIVPRRSPCIHVTLSKQDGEDGEDREPRL